MTFWRKFITSESQRIEPRIFRGGKEEQGEQYTGKKHVRWQEIISL